MSYRDENPDASPFVLVTEAGIPMALPKDIPAGDVLLSALGHAELGDGPIRVYNGGTHICTVEVPA